MSAPHHLDLSPVYPQNQQLFAWMVELYQLPNLATIKALVPKLDASISVDYALLVEQIKDLVKAIGVDAAPKINQTLNSAVSAQSYTKVADLLSRSFNLKHPQVGGSLVPKVMELGNIYRFLDYLNHLPGSSGQAINIIRLTEFK